MSEKVLSLQPAPRSYKRLHALDLRHSFAIATTSYVESTSIHSALTSHNFLTMADVAAPPPAATAATESGAAPVTAKASTSKSKATKPRKPVTPASHPKYKDMIASAIGSLKERRGSSRQAILKYILSHYKVGGEVSKVNARVKMTLRAGLKNGQLRQVKGSGASGSFRLGERVKSLKQPTKAVARKPLKPAAKKAAAAKKSKSAAGKKPKVATKKPAKKATSSASKKLKSPKKVLTKKPKSGGKGAGRSPSKKRVTKPKKAAKKTPAKKASKPKMSRK